MKKWLILIFFAIVATIGTYYIYQSVINRDKISLSKFEDIDICEKDSDCIIVPYRHCCGSTKKAINKIYKEIYDQNPQWHEFSIPIVCQVVGLCRDDTQVTKVSCQPDESLNRCQLVFK